MIPRSLPFLFLCVLCVLWSTPSTAAKPPNIVVVLCDDLGYADLACYGNPDVQTPHLDAFAAESLRFTNCYSAAANCSPARTGLMTGRTPYRVGVYAAIPFMSPMHVRDTEVTIATLLRDQGYATCHTGKWHMNGMFNLPGQPQPVDHGFEYSFGTQNNCLPNHRNPWNFVRNSIPVGPLEGYAAGIVVNEADHWLRDLRDKTKPFFLYTCFHEPHEPVATDAKYTDLYKDFPDPSQRAYLGNITQMDAAFGKLMATLDELHLRENTLVFFTSDNGPALTRYHPYGSTGPLRAKKGYMYEGGIRVPGILRWPGHTRPGTESDEPISGIDLLPTLCALTGTDLPAGRKLDGANILPALEEKPLTREVPLYWQYNLALGEPKVAIREGDWKLLARLDPSPVRAGGGLTEEQMKILKTAEPTGFELYHLGDDIAEATERSASEPERLAAMKAKLIAHYHDVRAEAPTWPAWAPLRYEATRIEWPNYKALIKPPK